MFSAIRAPVAARSFARSFSTTQAKLDLSKVTLIGRLGADPVKRETGNGKPYYTYPVATQGPAVKDAEGNYTDGLTSWHTVFSFAEGQHSLLERLGKGSTIYVEAELEMRRGEPIDGNPVPDRVFLRQSVLRPINRVKSEAEADAE